MDKADIRHMARDTEDKRKKATGTRGMAASAVHEATEAVQFHILFAIKIQASEKVAGTDKLLRK